LFYIHTDVTDVIYYVDSAYRETSFAYSNSLYKKGALKISKVLNPNVHNFR